MNVINNMGEPGRTILRQSIFKNEEDSSLVEHVHFESTEQLQSRRIKLMNRCIELLK